MENKIEKIDIDKWFDDKILSEHNNKVIKKYENDDNLTSILSPEKMNEWLYKKRKAKMPIEVFNPESKKRVNEDKETGEIIPEDIDETDIKLPQKKGIKGKAKRKPTATELELIKYPSLRQQIINNVKHLGRNKNQTESINTYDFVDRWGKVRNVVFGNTRLGHNISREKVLNWGSVGDFDIDTIPLSYIKAKGTEVTYISYESKQVKNKQLINRRFLCNVLSTWGYLLGIQYTSTDKYKMTGIKIWCRGIEYEFTDTSGNKTELKRGEHSHINPADVTLMMKDILYIMRGKKFKYIKDEMINGNVSPNLYNTIFTLAKKEKTSMEDILQECKERFYKEHRVIDYNTGQVDFIWNYTKWCPEMITGYIRELNSGKYFTDILYPIIKNMHYKSPYPIKCTDTHLKRYKVTVDTDGNIIDEHKKNNDDYDINQYYIDNGY